MPRLSAAATHRVRFALNFTPVAVDVEPRTSLADALRHGLGATGTHVGCEHGVCGACTVAIDGVPARACLTLAVQVEGSTIGTVEGLAPAPDRLSVLQEAFRRHHALQCGFCTPGILMSVATLLAADPAAGDAALEDAIAGHLCRCTGYAPILAAAREAAAILRDGNAHV